MTNTEILGYIAASFTTFCFIPQAWNVIKTRDTKSISLTMYSMFTCGVVLWTVYSYIIASKPMLIANIITFVLAIIILISKIRFG